MPSNNMCLCVETPCLCEEEEEAEEGQHGVVERLQRPSVLFSKHAQALERAWPRVMVKQMDVHAR